MTKILNLIKIGEGHSLEFKESYTDTTEGKITFDKKYYSFDFKDFSKSSFNNFLEKAKIKTKTLFILTFKRPNLQIDSYQTRVLGIGKETVEKSSQKSSQKIIDLINANNLITIEELSIKLNLTDRAIKKNIAKLKEKGIIKRVGPDKGGYWGIIKQ